MPSRMESFFAQIIMEESSPFFGVTTNQWSKFLDSNISNLQFPIKHQTSGAGASASKFKGVVSQPNGHWGAQIYTNHQRIWLGTFKSENEAAMAYDSAAIKLRNGFANRNFQWTDITIREPSFQDQFSTEIVLAMIKDGSYASKFSDFLRAQDRCGLRLAALQDPPDTRLRQLFQKELTPSDVGKLNRLVIPKKFALKYFPRICDVKARDGGSSSVDDIELVFFERSMRSWNFRYCYWKSSQSFVFTRGWNRFAREKKLKSRDRVIFSSYERSGQKLCIIDVVKDGRSRDDDDNDKGMKMKMERMEVEGNSGMNEESEREMKENVPSLSSKGFRLFGVEMV